MKRVRFKNGVNKCLCVGGTYYVPDSGPFLVPDNIAEQFEDDLEVFDDVKKAKLSDMTTVDESVMLELSEMGVKSVEDIDALTEADLTSINSMGVKKARQIKKEAAALIKEAGK